MATLFQDIKLSSDGDLDLSSGDLLIAASDQQHIIDIIMTFPNEWKQYPSVGVGLPGYFKTSGKEQEVRRNVDVQLTNDGYTVSNPVVTLDANGNMNVKPNAVRQ